MIDFDVSFTYENDKEETLKGVKGTAAEGKCIVLCGGSGCGKTTLIRCFNHLIPEFFEGEMKGYVSIKGENIEDYSVGKVGRMVASVFQDPRSHFFTINSSTEVAFAMENFGIPVEEMKKRVDESFSLFGLEYLQNRNVYELSSGERQLISIISAWACNTDVLILDEPTANLDYVAIKELSRLLRKLKEQGKTLILSEHRLHYLSDIADEYWVIKNGEIEKRLSKEEMLSLNIDELSSLSLRTTTLNKVTVDDNSSNVSSDSCTTLKVENLSFSYKRKSRSIKETSDGILSNLSFSAKTGDVVGIIGSNGCGKTTFGKIVSGLIKSKCGTISINDKILKHKELAKNTLFIMQETEFQFFTNTVMNELKYGHINKEDLDEKIEFLLKKCDMWHLRNRHPFSLSGGQMQRLALMIACLSAKKIIVLDEPTAGLDKKSLDACVELIKEMRKEKIVLIISHDVELIAKACTRCECIKNGSFVKSFNLDKQANTISEVISYMDANFSKEQKKEEDGEKELSKGRLDPRTKLFITIVALLVMACTNIKLVMSLEILIFILAIVEGFFVTSFIGIITVGALWLTYFVCPVSILTFFADFLPRMVMPFLALQTIILKSEGTRTLAAFRKLHVPEKLIMILSVIFRFFPVLSNDIKLMNQSIKTRGVFQKISQKIKAFPQYLEVMIVPLALRVIKIGETLSASAETRGIDLRGKRTSYITLKMSALDIIFFVLTIISIVVGIII